MRTIVFPSDPAARRQRHRAGSFLTRIHYGVMYAHVESFMYVDHNIVGWETRGRKSLILLIKRYVHHGIGNRAHKIRLHTPPVHGDGAVPLVPARH